MNTKKKTIKSILGCTTACSALIMAGVGAIDLTKPNIETYATNVDMIPVSISNSNFDSNKSSSYPYSPNSFTAYVGDKTASSSNNSVKNNIKAGVINLSNEDYETKFSLAKRDSLDDYILMIDSTDKDDETKKHTVNYGYRTNSSFTLDVNSKYMFTIDVFTATNANIANLYLFDSTGKVFSSIKGINSYNTWTTYSFFVSTNNYEKVELKLGMYLEGAGTVLFDNISGYKLSHNQYDSNIKSLTAGTFKEVDEIDNVERTYYINKNGQLEYKTLNDNVPPVEELITSNFTAVDYEFEKNSTLSHVTEGDGQNNYALLVKNDEKTYAQYETEDIFTFEQNTVYKVDVNVKTKNLDGTASLQLIRTDIDEDDKQYNASSHNKKISITSNSVSSSDSVTNDYKTYTFLINSHSSKDVSFKLKFGLGANDALTSGEMYLSEIEISKVNYSTFESASTGSGTEKINLVDAYSDSDLYFNNGDFNAFKIADYNAPMPATPVDWTVTTGANIQKYGVVNTKTFDNLKELNLSNLKNPSKDTNNNILMMYNETADSLSYKSSPKTLSAQTYHKFTIDVQTQNAPANIELVATVNGEEVVLSAKTINTNYLWETVTFYLFTGYQELSVSLKLSLNTTGYGYAYADNATFDYALTSTQLENEFKSASNSNLVVVTDLSNILTSASNDKFANADMFITKSVSGVECGTLTLNSSYLDEVITYEETGDATILNNLEIFNSLAGNTTDKKVIGIWTTEDVNYTISSKLGYKISSGSDKYYKISLDVFTQNLSTNNTEVDEDLLGAGIKLSNYDASFTAIKSDNKWTTYTFYIKADADTTTYLDLSLGSDEATTKGAAFFGNINFVDNVSADEFNSVKENEFVKILKTETTDTEDSTDKTDSEDSGNKSNNTWIYLIPSLLTALAILIAIVGFAVRKIKWKKPTKKSKTAYDRNKTVSVQYYSRKATAMREEKIRELTADLNKVNAERKQYEDEYKQNLTKLREMKIKRANPSDIAKFEKELKKNQRVSSTLGMTANRINDELNYVKTSAYLNNLIKKLSREQSSVTNQNEDNK